MKTAFINTALCLLLLLVLPVSIYGNRQRKAPADIEPLNINISFGAGIHYLYMSEAAQKFSLTSSQTLIGVKARAHFQLLPQLSLGAGIGWLWRIQNTINNKKIDQSKRRQWFWPISGTLYYHLPGRFSFLSAGTGFTLFWAGSNYYDGNAEPDSTYLDFLIQFSVMFRYNITERYYFFAEPVYYFNLTPGRFEVLGSNELQNRTWELSAGVMYRYK